MSAHGKSLLVLLQRCVAVRPPTLKACVTAAGDVLSYRYSLVQRRTWTSTAWAGRARRLGQLQSTVWSSQLGVCTEAGPLCKDEYPPLLPYQDESESEKDIYIVQVRGLPWSCTDQDLLQFFSECRIHGGVKGIHLTMNLMGKPSGEAFIEFEHKVDVSKALEKHRQYLGPRYVEVSEVTNADAQAILNKNSISSPDNWVVRLRGLPYTSTQAEIAQFFSGLDIIENGITFVTGHTGRKTGEAFVQFSSQESTEEALKRDKEVIGTRYIEVFPSRIDEIHSVKKRRVTSDPPHTDIQSHDPTFAPYTNPKPEFPRGSDPHHIHMRGLPFQATGEDIVKFFHPVPVSRILIEYGPNGRPRGEASVYFYNHKDTVTAMMKDRMYLGERYIELYLNSPLNSGRR